MAFVTINGYPLDLVETEEHGLESEITEHPVEDGSDISDNIRRKPRTLTFTGAVVSDTPIGAIANEPTRRSALSTLAPGGAIIETGDGRNKISNEAWRRLEAMWLAGQPVVVVTDFKRYESMGIESLSNPISAKNAGGLVFTVKFKEVRIVKNKRVTIAVVNGGPRNNRGARQGKTVDSGAIVWNKGKPSGAAPYTNPKGVIYATELVVVVKPQGKIGAQIPGGGKITAGVNQASPTQYVHETGPFAGAYLTDAERAAFFLDMQRDSIHDLAATAAAVQAKSNALDTKMQHVKDLSDYVDEHPGATPDPAMFGLQQNNNPDGTFKDYTNLPPPGAKTE